jgi:HEAT repeat protein
VEPFLEDASEAIRFVAVATVFAQEDAASVAPLAKALVAEESVRVKNRLLEGLAARGWAIPEELREPARAAMAPQFTLDPQGKVKRR